MRNVCRPFTLYSDFLPPAKVSREWQYLAFGYFDGVNVGNNLFKDERWDFERMWEHSESEKTHLDGSYTEQTIFGFRTEEEGCEKDKQFWEDAEGEKYPFLFLILIQDKASSKNPAGFCQNRKQLEESLSVNKGVSAISYLTLDSSDLLLVLACEEYSLGAKLIDSFHTGDESSVLSENGWNLYYSYTISAVRKSFLNNEDKIARLKGILDSVYIHVIEKQPGSIKEVYDFIRDKWPGEAEKKETEKKAVLGCNDDLIIMKGVPWSVFLTFYQDRTGILNHSNTVYHKSIIGVTTILGEEEKERGKKESGEESDNEKIITLSKSLRKECIKFKLDNGSSKGRAVRKELLSVLNSLEKYEKSPFHDYIFMSALKPMKMLVDMVKEADKKEDEDKYGYFYDFLTSFNMYAQNSMRSDRQFTEVPDFNIRIYETPAKMNAFYNAVIYNLKSLLSEMGTDEKEMHEYEFLTCPGVANDMQVREIYPELMEDKRLFLVDMPEKQVYSPWLMFIMIAHEMSHFVGREIRQRDYRYHCMVKMVSDIVIRYLYEELSEYIDDEEPKGRLEKRLQEFCEFSEWNPLDWGIYAVIDKLVYLLKECFADLGAVMLLDLSVEEYLESILLSAYDQGIDIEMLSEQTEGIIRGALVCLCMISDEEGCLQKWTVDEVFDITKREGNISVLANSLWKVMCIYSEKYEKGLGN